MTGLHLSQYRIDAELGRGGMGIVYKATDTKLNRTVALKVLPAAALSSEDDRARFVREAQSAAQLHHPNIATVFGIDEAVPVEEGKEPQPGTETRLFIAMEYIEGETVREVVEKGPLKLQDAVNIAGQVAEALKEAHAKQIVHRDIKSANVMLTSQGVAKVLDFGLAKTNQSTMLTRMGSTLGTVAYMSPEQARGHEVDGRTDLYSLGTMLYEMVAGKLPFAGDYEQAVLYGIMNEPPEPLTAVRTGVPMQLEWIVNKLLSKEAEYRYQTAGDLLADLKSLDVGGSGTTRRSMPAVSAASSTPADAPRTIGMPIWGYAAIAGTLLVGLAVGWALKPSAPGAELPIRRLTIELDGYAEVVFPTASPDGRYWAFRSVDTLANTGIVVFDTRTGESSMVPGSSQFFYPIFSPSGAELLMSWAGEAVRVVIPGGRPIRIADNTGGGIDWLDDAHIVQADLSGTDPSVDVVSIQDGSRRTVLLSSVDSTFVSLDYIRRIGDTRRFVGSWTRSTDAGGTLTLIDLDKGTVSMLRDGACCATPVGESYLVYLEGMGSGQLMAQAFDPDAGRLTGAPVNLLDSDMDEVGFGVGADGSLMVGSEFIGESGESLTWLTPETRALDRLNLPVRDYDRVALSPDARFAAIERRSSGERAGDIYLMNLDDGTEQRFTYNHPINRVPTWTSDGRIFYAGGPQGLSDVYVKNADGSGVEQLVVENGDFPTVSEDGKWVAFVRSRRHENLIAKNLETGEEIAVDTTELKTNDPAISPNGRWIAFSADPQYGPRVSQQQRVYVRSFPDPSELYQLVSDTHGDDPTWSSDGKWLYYRSRGEVFRVAVSTDGTFQKLSLPESIGSFSGITVRLAVNRVTGQVLIVHPGEASATRETSLTLFDGFPRLLQELAPSVQ